MHNDELLREADKLRELIDHPVLTKRNYIAATVFSMLGPGSTMAAIFGYGDYIYNIKDAGKYASGQPKNYSSKLNEALSSWRNFDKFSKDPKNKGFMQNALITIGTFLVASVTSLPYFLSHQRNQRAEASAVKLSHIERVLEERGYEREVKSDRYVKRYADLGEEPVSVNQPVVEKAESFSAATNEPSASKVNQLKNSAEPPTTGMKNKKAHSSFQNLVSSEPALSNNLDGTGRA